MSFDAFHFISRDMKASIFWTLLGCNSPSRKAVAQRLTNQLARRVVSHSRVAYKCFSRLGVYGHSSRFSNQWISKHDSDQTVSSINKKRRYGINRTAYVVKNPPFGLRPSASEGRDKACDIQVVKNCIAIHIEYDVRIYIGKHSLVCN